MSNNRGERLRPPHLVEWIDESPAKIMRNAWLRTIKAVSDDHNRLRRIRRIRNEWLSKGEKCTGKIPPGAFRRQGLLDDRNQENKFLRGLQSQAI